MNDKILSRFSTHFFCKYYVSSHNDTSSLTVCYPLTRISDPGCLLSSVPIHVASHEDRQGHTAVTHLIVTGSDRAVIRRTTEEFRGALNLLHS